MRKKHIKGIEQIKSKYGVIFVAPWFIGFIIFFLVPVIQSLWFSFCDVTMSTEGVETEFIGLETYKYYLEGHADFTELFLADLTSVMYSLPIILMVSLVLAILLNNKFRGRLFFRALYFMPVIIASGVVLKILFMTTDEEALISSGVNVSLTDSMFSVEDVVGWLDMPDNIAVIVKSIINNIFDLLWSSGIQTVLFIAGLQSIPSTLYEASKVEGASKWEEFWFITFPMLGSVTMLVMVFTVVDLLTSTRRGIINLAYNQMNAGVYDSPSTILWMYFLVVGVLMALILFLYNKILLKRWQ